MIDIEKAKREFLNYTSNYDSNNKHIRSKISHSLRVMNYSTKIAESLNLSKQQIDLATLIGLLHDIARFEQRRIYNTFVDNKSVDHGDLGVEILEKDNFIRTFIETDEYDEIIKTAIKNHNKYKIEDSLSEDALLQAKIVRDADKLDILFEAVEIFWNTDEDKINIENSDISEDYLKQFEDKKQILRSKVVSNKLDGIIGTVSFIFDLNFKYSINYVYNENYINKILNRFEYKNEDVKNKIKKVKNISKKFLENF